jgi:hypothetical protein
MNQEVILRAASRARWIAELSAALAEAQQLLACLVAERVELADADRLRIRIEDIRAELQWLHRRGFASKRMAGAPHVLHPDWQPSRD